MIRQSQNYFAAAVSAALVNAAAITAFVLFMILSSVHGFGLRSVLDAVDSIGSPSQSSGPSSVQTTSLRDALLRDAGSGSARLVPNAGSTAGSESKAFSATVGSHGGVDVANAKGGSAPGPSGSAGGTSGAGSSGGSPTSGGPLGGGPSLPTPSTGGPTGSLNIPNTVNNAVNSATQGVGSATSNAQSAGAGVANTVTGTANGLLGTNPVAGGSGGGSSAPASAPSLGTGSVNGAVKGATGAVKNAGVKLPGLS